VLLVEDDERWREAIGAFLEDRGYPTALAEDEEHAAHLLATIGRPCLVLLDLLTLHIDLSRLLAALGRNDRVATIPMVLVSVSAPELLSKPVAMKRPVDLEILFRIVQAHCCGGSRGGTKPAGGRRPLHGE
jgi:CheY-like chemotaxis protein